MNARNRPLHTPVVNLETARLLNMRERAAIRAAHTFGWDFTAGRHVAVCSCGTTFTSTHAHVVSDATRTHVLEVMDFAAGRKCAEARANAAIDDALLGGAR